MLEHSMDSVQQFPHDRTVTLQWQLDHSDGMPVVSIDVQVVLNSAHDREIKGCTDVAVARLRYPGFLVDALAEVEGLLAKPRESEYKPVSTVYIAWQNKTGFSNVQRLSVQ